jgi:hypothetical protein
MQSCEDFPACGHELGCCPDTDPDTGRVLNMRCTCGAKVPLGSRFSICDGCMQDPDEDPGYFYPEDDR